MRKKLRNKLLTQEVTTKMLFSTLQEMHIVTAVYNTEQYVLDEYRDVDSNVTLNNIKIYQSTVNQ